MIYEMKTGSSFPFYDFIKVFGGVEFFRETFHSGSQNIVREGFCP